MGLLLKEHKAFDVVIGGKLYEVWNRPEHEHNLGKMNGCPSTWWVKYRELPDGEIQWIEWIDRGTNRPSWDIQFKTGNSVKIKWGDYDISRTGGCEIYCNLRKVYGFGFGDLNWAMAKAQTLITEMMEHPFDFSNPEGEIGRKIWYYDQPAVIESLMLDQGCIMIRKDDPKNPIFNLTKPWDDEEIPDEWNGEEMVKDDILESKHIWWFR